MKPLEVGKLYCVREDPLLLMDRPDGNKVVTCIDTSVPFLLLKVEGTNLQVLFEDKTGWVELRTDNPVVEFV